MYKHMFITEYRYYLHSNLEVLIWKKRELEDGAHRLLGEQGEGQSRSDGNVDDAGTNDDDYYVGDDEVVEISRI